MHESETSESSGATAPGFEPAMPFVHEVLARLRECCVQYCVLRNYHSLPQGLGGTDLDLLVNAEDLEAAYRVLFEAAARHGGACISGYRAEALITSFCGRTAGVWWGVKIDVFPGLTHRGVPFYDARDLLQRAPDWHGIPVAPEGEAGIIALLKELLTNSASRKDYDKSAAVEYARNPSCYEKRLGSLFGPGAVAAFRQYLAHLGSPRLMRRAARRLRWALCWRSFCRQPMQLLAMKVVGWARRFRRLLFPPGIVLAVLGTEDSERSGLITRIRPVLEAAVHGHVHLRRLCPEGSVAIAPGHGGRDMEVHVPGSRPSGLFGGWKSLFRLVQYPLDYCLSYWTAIYPWLVKLPCLWILEGRFQDFPVAPLQRGAALVQRIMRGLAFALPKPDVVICLGAGLEAIGGRELSPAAEDVNRRATCVRGGDREDARVVWVGTDGTPEERADRVLSVVVARASARYRTGRLPGTVLF